MVRSVDRTAAPSADAMLPVMRDRAMTRHGTTVQYLRAVLPISLRTAQDTGRGNKITLMRLTVPAGNRTQLPGCACCTG